MCISIINCICVCICMYYECVYIFVLFIMYYNCNIVKMCTNKCLYLYFFIEIYSNHNIVVLEDLLLHFSRASVLDDVISKLCIKIRTEVTTLSLMSRTSYKLKK